MNVVKLCTYPTFCLWKNINIEILIGYISTLLRLCRYCKIYYGEIIDRNSEICALIPFYSESINQLYNQNNPNCLYIFVRFVSFSNKCLFICFIISASCNSFFPWDSTCKYSSEQKAFNRRLKKEPNKKNYFICSHSFISTIQYTKYC